MSGSTRRLTTALAIAVVLSSWACGSTAPSATPQVAAIVVSPATSTLVPDAQLPLQAQVQNGSGEVVPNADVTWTVQDPSVVSVSPAGVVKALAVGTSQVAANALGKSGIAVITVAPPTTTGSANPGNDDPGNDDSGNAGPVDEDPVDQDPGGEGSGDENSGEENSGDDDPGNGTPTGNDNAGVVATVTVTAPSTELATGSTMRLTATAKDDKGNPVSQQSFAWSSSNTDKATVSSSGVVTAKQPGSVTITARTSSTGGKSGSVKILIKKK